MCVIFIYNAIIDLISHCRIFFIDKNRFSTEQIPNGCVKKVVVVSARVHPGESQSSWMMKGVLDFITGPDTVAKVT